MLRAVPYEPWHLKLIDVEQEPEHAKALRYVVADMFKQHMVFTGVNETDVLVVAGVISLWKGVGEATIYISKKYFDGTLSLKDRNTAVKECRRYFNVIIKNLKLHRVQAHVDANFDRANKFAKFFGFEYESIMPKYGPNKEDYVRYVMFPEVDQW